MQAYSDRAAVCETLQTGLATFYSRSRAERWCKGETSGAYIRVMSVHADCDRDSLVYLGDPIGPACHTGARTCWFKRAPVLLEDQQEQQQQEHGVAAAAAAVADLGEHTRHGDGAPLTTLLALERTIAERRREAEEDDRPEADPAAPKKKPSWTARLLADEALLCKKVREEAGELCETLERREGKERAASEAADLLYHAMVLLNAQEVPLSDVVRVLRKRFGVSGVEERAARPAGQQQ
jgi:phosphoribosyl-AMP cyclohydrolase / phosphoribosyl-ATP pyrophosphohydrolase